MEHQKNNMRFRISDGVAELGQVSINEDSKLGVGATATVFKIEFFNTLWAAKIYKDKLPDENKLKAMIANCPSIAEISDEGVKFVQLTWPKYLVMDTAGDCVGFLMSYLDEEKTYSLDTFYDPVLVKRLKGQAEAALSLRIEIAFDLCTVMSEMHKLRHYFIDIKPQNIRVYKGFNRVALLDCDGFSIRHEADGLEKRFPAQLISTDYVAPEFTNEGLSPTDLSENQDLYGLAVILFQLLNRGTHPFQGIVHDPFITSSTNDERSANGLYPHGLTNNPKVSPRKESIHDLFLYETRLLFDRAFSNSAEIKRPTALEWKAHFINILENKLLSRCQIEPTDVRHIHFSGKDCIGCRIKNQKKNSKRPLNHAYKVPPIPRPSQSKPPTTSGTSKPVESSGWGVTFSILLVIFVVLIGLFSSDNTSKSTKQQTTRTQENTPIVSGASNSCLFNFDELSVDDLCSHYWNNQYPQCDKVILEKLNNKQVSWFPQNKCGTKISNSSPIPSSSDPAPVPKTLKDKVEYLASKSSSSAITLSSFPPELTSSNYFTEISNVIIQEFRRVTSIYENGIQIYEGINLQFISNVTFTANSGESCNGTSYGRSTSCLISGNVARCQNIEIDKPVKSSCLESFRK
jgi:hypothetical protein